jgi:hypothetical protein
MAYLNYQYNKNLKTHIPQKPWNHFHSKPIGRSLLGLMLLVLWFIVFIPPANAVAQPFAIAQQSVYRCVSIPTWHPV